MQWVPIVICGRVAPMEEQSEFGLGLLILSFVNITFLKCRSSSNETLCVNLIV